MRRMISLNTRRNALTSMLMLAVGFLSAAILLLGQRPAAGITPLGNGSGTLNQPRAEESKERLDQQATQEELLLLAFNCARKQHGLPAYLQFDPMLSHEAARVLEALPSNPQALDAMEGYTTRATLALNFAAPAQGCGIGGNSPAFLADLVKPSQAIGIALQGPDQYGMTAAVILGR